jgi:hypothetical protein
MTTKINWITWLKQNVKEFILEPKSSTPYEIIELYTCEETGFTKAIIKLSGRHSIEKYISDIITDNEFIEGLDKKTIRTLTYMATVERLKPDYSVVVQQLSDQVDDYILEIQSRHKKEKLKLHASTIAKDKSLINKFSPSDANRIGYLAGIKETTQEYKIKSENT